MAAGDWDQFFTGGAGAGASASPAGGPGVDWDSYFGAGPGNVATFDRQSPSPQSVSAAPPQDTSWLRYPVMLGQAAVRGLTQAASLPGELLSAVGVPQLTPEQQADIQAVSGSPALIFPTRAQIESQLGSAEGDVRHLVGQGPHPEAERLLTAPVEAIAANAPYVLAGPEGLATRLGLSAAAGEAGELAQEYAPNVSGGPAAAGLVVGGAGQLVRNLASGHPVARIASSLGTSSTPEEAGTTLQQWAKSFRDPENPQGMDAQLSTARAQLDAAIPAGTTVDHAQLLSNANELLARGGRAADAVRNFFRQTVKSGGQRGAAAAAVQGDLAPGGALVPGAGAAPLDWQASAGLRSELGAAYRSTRDPTERSALKYLYAGHTQDLGQAAAEAGAGDQFSAFNGLSTDLHSLDEGPVESLLSNNPGPVAVSLINQAKKGGTHLAGLRAAGAPVDELAAGTLQSNPGVWKNLSPEGKLALVGNPDLLDRLDRFARPPSKLAQLSEAYGNALVGGGLGSLAGHLYSGDSPTGAILGAALGEAAGRFAPQAARIISYPLRPNMLGAELAGAEAGAAGGEAGVRQNNQISNGKATK